MNYIGFCAIEFKYDTTGTCNPLSTIKELFEHVCPAETIATNLPSREALFATQSHTNNRVPPKLQNQILGLSRSFLGHFPGLFKVFFTGLKIQF